MFTEGIDNFGLAITSISFGNRFILNEKLYRDPKLTSIFHFQFNNNYLDIK